MKDRLIRQVDLGGLAQTIRFAIVWPHDTSLIRNCGWMELKDVNHPNVRAGVVEFLQEYSFPIPTESDLTKWGEPAFTLRKRHFGFPEGSYSGIYFDILDWLGKQVWESTWMETDELALDDKFMAECRKDVVEACKARGIQLDEAGIIWDWGDE